jgi:hypothetical protein
MLFLFSSWINITFRTKLRLSPFYSWCSIIDFIFLSVWRWKVCIIWDCSFGKIIRRFLRSKFWCSIRLNCVGHLRIYSIIWPIPPLIDLTSRFIDMIRWMLICLIAGKQEVYTADGNFLYSLHFIIDRNSQTIIDSVFIKIYHSLSDQELTLFRRNRD